MVHLILQMHAIVNDVCGDKKGDAGKERIEGRLSGGNGNLAAGEKVGEPAEQQLDKRDQNSQRALNQPEAEQTDGD